MTKEETDTLIALDHLASTADWYRRCLEDVIDRKPVRGLDEARSGYDNAYAKALQILKDAGH